MFLISERKTTEDFHLIRKYCICGLWVYYFSIKTTYVHCDVYHYEYLLLKITTKEQYFIFTGFTSTQQSPNIDFTKVKLSRNADIKVKSATDRRWCIITDLVVLPGDLLLLADHNNQSVKLADPASGQLLDQLQLPGSPHGLCLLPRDRAAVTIPGKSTIQTISVTMKKLSLQNVINVNGECYGIDYVNNYFVVGFHNPAMLALIDKKGNIYKSITTDSINHTLFKEPNYICVATENTSKVIYVSDRGTSTITRLSEELQVLQSFTDPALQNLHGLASLGGGQLLVVNSSSSSTLSVLDVTTGQVTQLRGQEEDLNSICCVAVSHTLGTVYVDGWFGQYIRQYTTRQH